MRRKGSVSSTEEDTGHDRSQVGPRGAGGVYLSMFTHVRYLSSFGS